MGDADCKRATEVVRNHSAGDSVCTVCGLILNNFSTVISKPNNNLSPSLSRWLNQETNNPDRKLIHAFKTINTMANRLGLGSLIKDCANAIYKQVEDLKFSRGRKNQDAILAACLYIACRQEDKTHTIKEICSVANGASKDEIERDIQYIVKQLELEMGTIRAGDFMRRFCSTLGMNDQAVKAAQEAVQKLENFDTRRSPVTIAAAVIYIITQQSDDKKPLKDVSIATGVAERTIKRCIQGSLSPYFLDYIPSWYAKDEDLRTSAVLDK